MSQQNTMLQTERGRGGMKWGRRKSEGFTLTWWTDQSFWSSVSSGAFKLELQWETSSQSSVSLQRVVVWWLNAQQGTSNLCHIRSIFAVALIKSSCPLYHHDAHPQERLDYIIWDVQALSELFESFTKGRKKFLIRVASLLSPCFTQSQHLSCYRDKWPNSREICNFLIIPSGCFGLMIMMMRKESFLETGLQVCVTRTRMCKWVTQHVG